MKKTAFWNLPRTLVVVLAAWVFLLVQTAHVT